MRVFCLFYLSKNDTKSIISDCNLMLLGLRFDASNKLKGIKTQPKSIALAKSETVATF